MPHDVPTCNRQAGVLGAFAPCDEPATLVLRHTDLHYLTCRPCAEAFAAEGEDRAAVSLHEFTFDPVAGTVAWTEPLTRSDLALLPAWLALHEPLGLNDAGEFAYAVAVRRTTVQGRPYWALASPWRW
jgi:hypothetical protein